jgi:DNA-binding beta-propeller fold protein YncE
MVWFVVAGCREPEPPRPRPDPDPPPAHETAHTGGTTETSGGSGHTGTPRPTGDTAQELDCSVLPPVPVPFVTMPNYQTSEDFDFDDQGYLCTVRLSGDLACKDQAGNVRIEGPRAAPNGSAGTRFLPNGDWVIAGGDGTLIKVDHASGSNTVVVAGLLYPNGVEVGRDGFVYVAENASDRVRQIDPYTGDQWLVGDGLVSPNGVILSPDEQTLYVGSFGGGNIYAFDRIADHEWSPRRILASSPGWDGGFDGINVDICGNVYITEFQVGRIWRITPDGLTVDQLVNLPDPWIPNLRWGSGVGGWDEDVLYVTAWTRLQALDVGIPGKPHISRPWP